MAGEFKFIHCADLHLDSPFQGLAIKEPSLADKFKHATNGSFVKIIDLCLAEGVDFLTIGGDTFDGADRSLKAQILLRDQFRRLQNANIPVIIVAGNHDPLSDWVEEITFPENVHLLSGDSVESVPIKKDGNTITSIYGISYKDREVQENLSLKYKVENKETFSIAMLHANVGSRKEHELYSPCTVNDLKSRDMDMWLLGHIHVPEVICKAPFMLYPGNIQGRHIRESGPRGCFLVKVSVEGKVSHKFKPVQSIVWKNEQLNVENIATLPDLVDSLSNKIEENLASLTNGEKGMVVRWELKGPTLLYHDLIETGKSEEIKEILIERFFNQTPFMFPESFRLSIKPVQNIEDYINQENFIGDFLRLAKKAGRDDQMKEGLLEMLNQPLTNKTIGKYFNEIDRDELKNILKESVNLGMDLLSGESK